MANPTMLDAPAHFDAGQDRSQATKRRYRFYLDQHKRKWGSAVENKTGEPCGPFEKQGWTAPLQPEPKYMTVDPVENTLYIDYEQWVRDIDEAHAYWHARLREAAGQIYGQGAVGEAIKNPQPELLDRVGPQPNQRKEPVEAAMLGNKWVLGLTDLKPAWAYEFFPDEEEAEPEEVIITNKYPDVGEEGVVVTDDYPRWAGPNKGWVLSDGEAVERFDGEDKESYKQRALDAEASLHN